MDIMDFEYNKLDDEWITKFENTDKLYQPFYKECLFYINLKFIYLKRSNEIHKIKTESFILAKPNIISREEILGILKKNLLDNEINYSLLSILKYNITLDTDDIVYFLKDKIKNNFLIPLKNIDTIFFEKSINMFNDLNELIIIFYEKSNILKEKNINNITKKILSNINNNKKTIKKQYKD